MLKSSGGIGAATLTSRVLGLVREQSLRRSWGRHGVAAAFSYAFMVPNLFRRLLGEGALTAAFIPIFKAKEKNEGEASMWQAANAVISGLIAVSPAIVFYAMVVISLLLLGGWWDTDTRLMFQLMRLMFPYMMLACLGAVFMGILNARGHFFIPALGAAVLNIVMIASVWFLAPHFGPTLDGPRCSRWPLACWWQEWRRRFSRFPPASGGFRYRWVSPWRDPTVREVVTKMIPSTIGVAAFQINVMLTQSLAFGESARIVGEFAYAVRADGTAAGRVRTFAGDLSAADAVRAGAGEKLRAISRHVAAGGRSHSVHQPARLGAALHPGRANRAAAL